jgi:hypothetical protein
MKKKLILKKKENNIKEFSRILKLIIIKEINENINNFNLLKLNESIIYEIFEYIYLNLSKNNNNIKIFKKLLTHLKNMESSIGYYFLFYNIILNKKNFLKIEDILINIYIDFDQKKYDEINNKDINENKEDIKNYFNENNDIKNLLKIIYEKIDIFENINNNFNNNSDDIILKNNKIINNNNNNNNNNTIISNKFYLYEKLFNFEKYEIFNEIKNFIKENSNLFLITFPIIIKKFSNIIFEEEKLFIEFIELILNTFNNTQLEIFLNFLNSNRFTLLNNNDNFFNNLIKYSEKNFNKFETNFIINLFKNEKM